MARQVRAYVPGAQEKPAVAAPAGLALNRMPAWSAALVNEPLKVTNAIALKNQEVRNASEL